MLRTTPLRVTGLLLVALVLAGCGGARPTAGPASPSTSAPTSAPTSAVPTAGATTSGAGIDAPRPGAQPPAWLGTRVLPQTADGYVAPQRTPRELRRRAFTLPDTVPALPGRGWASDVVDPAPADVLARSTWVPGCPVASSDLAWVRVAFRGFDDQRHTGELLVAGSVATDLVGVFRDLWRADVPIEEMRITTPAEQTAPPTGDGNNTGAYSCRAVRGATTFSQHAYGLAVDVDPFQNPYTREGPDGTVVLPELATSYLDRDDVRPGMIEPDGPVVRAFAAIGWSWGGDYRSLKDYQHFSLTGG